MPGFSLRAVGGAVVLALGSSSREARAYEPPPPLPAYLAPRSITPPKIDPIPLEVIARAGFVYRWSDSATLPITSRLGGAGGLVLSLSPWERVAFAFTWEHASFGAERGRGDLADVSASRSLDAVWATLRIHLLRTDRVALLLELGPGFAVQHASASVRIYATDLTPASAFKCSESGGSGLGLRGGLGFAARLVGPLWITAEGIVDNVHLSTDPLGDCVPGAGTISLAGARFGLTYRRDVSRWLR